MKWIKQSPVTVAVFLAFCVCVFVMGMVGGIFNDVFLFRRELIEQGQLWRLVTGHLVHLGTYHTVMNLAGLVVWYALFGMPRLYHLIIMLFSLCLGTGILIFIFSSEVDYYAGLSGVLHGLIIYSLLMVASRDRIYWLFVVGLTGKVIYEHTPGYDVNYLLEQMNAPVVVDAHLYGFILGCVFALAKVLMEKFQSDK